ncbi:hypothetical protein VTN02DRAFT_5912 [Thermoascus thermophilus]
MSSSSTSSLDAAKSSSGPIYFGPFQVTSQVFHLTPLSFALVNIKPILPGHVLVCPRRRVPRVSDLTAAETTDLFLTARRVGRMVERVFGATSLNIAIQDGADAGQSVPHVHTHIIPRRRADLDHRGGTDAVYPMMDGEEGDIARFQCERMEDFAQGGERRRAGFPRVDNEERKPRSEAEMVAEAQMLAREMEKEPEE